MRDTNPRPLGRCARRDCRALESVLAIAGPGIRFYQDVMLVREADLPFSPTRRGLAWSGPVSVLGARLATVRCHSIGYLLLFSSPSTGHGPSGPTVVGFGSPNGARSVGRRPIAGLGALPAFLASWCGRRALLPSWHVDSVLVDESEPSRPRKLATGARRSPACRSAEVAAPECGAANKWRGGAQCVRSRSYQWYRAVVDLAHVIRWRIERRARREFVGRKGRDSRCGEHTLFA